MILYSENQLDTAWHYDCKQRTAKGRHWISRADYENLFVLYFESVLRGDELIKVDIYIPEDLLLSIDTQFEIDEEELH
jgi:hypothetical protein